MDWGGVGIKRQHAAGKVFAKAPLAATSNPLQRRPLGISAMPVIISASGDGEEEIG